jgi:hypothetical protein
MNIPRLNYERRPNAPSSLRPAKYARPKWIRVSHVGGPFLRDSGIPERRRIFAIVAPPKVDVSGKAIRRILIFDNHPDSLRLVSRLHVRPDDLAATPCASRLPNICIASDAGAFDGHVLAAHHAVPLTLKREQSIHLR